MTARLAPSVFDAPRPSARVRTVAETYFDADESQVRRLIQDGELETHTIGKRGVRVYLDSVAAYQQRHCRTARTPRRPGVAVTPPTQSKASRAAHEAAMVTLKANGFL